MKTTFIYLSIPFAVACTQNEKANNSTKTSALIPPPSSLPALAPPPEPTRIIGVVSYNDKCSLNQTQTKCLTVKGGDDLNDTQTFVLNESVNGFEVVDDKANPKSFRIWTDSKEKPVEVFENEHVSILANDIQKTGEADPIIASIESVTQLEK